MVLFLVIKESQGSSAFNCSHKPLFSLKACVLAYRKVHLRGTRLSGALKEISMGTSSYPTLMVSLHSTNFGLDQATLEENLTSPIEMEYLH